MSESPSASSSGRQGSDHRRLYLAGLIGPVVFWVVVITLGFITPGYSHINDAISDLGAIGAPYAPIQQASFVVLGFGILAFLAGLDRQFRDGSWPWVGVILVAIFGLLGAIGSGIFPVNPAEGAQLTDQLHGIAVIVGFHAGLIGIPLTTRGLAKAEAWTAYQSRAAVLGITAVIVGAYAIFISVGIGIEGYSGIAQRIYAGAMSGWVALHAYILYRA